MFEQIGLRIATALNGASISLRREEGQTLVEYALIIVTISIGVTAAMIFLRGEIAGVFSTIGSAL
jgi:Flp pilus assembly pilin Flp